MHQTTIDHKFSAGERVVVPTKYEPPDKGEVGDITVHLRSSGRCQVFYMVTLDDGRKHPYEESQLKPE